MVSLGTDTLCVMGAVPALTAREREMFERELIDVEGRLPGLRARGERLVALPGADVNQDELDRSHRECEHARELGDQPR